MTIENLGVKLYSGTKADRKSDSLGSSADGANTGIKNPNYSSNGLEFTGGEYVEVNGLRSTISGATSISMACWINPSDITDATILGFWNSGYEVIIFSINGSNKLQLVTKGADGSNLYMASSDSISADTLAHVAFTYDTSGTDTVKLYINGALDSAHTTNVPTSFPSSSTGNVYIGSHSAGTNYFDGTIKQYLVYSDVLTLTEIQTLYNSGTPVTSPSTSGLVSRYDFTANANDSQGSNNGTSSAIKLGTGAYYWDGSDSTDPEVSMNIGTTCAGATNEYTLAFWLKGDFDYTGSDNRCILDLSGSNSIQFFKHPTANWKWNFDSGDDLTLTGGATAVPNDGAFHHICITRNSSSLYTIYVDGTSKGSLTQTLNINSGSSQNLHLGAYSDYDGEYWKGSIDDVGLWSRVLTTTEISDLGGFRGASSQWISVGNKWDKRIVYNGNTDTSNHGVSFDLYSALGNSVASNTWVLRFEHTVTSTIGTTNGDVNVFCGISDKDMNTTHQQDQDWIGVRLMLSAKSGSDYGLIRPNSSNDAAPQSGSDSNNYGYMGSGTENTKFYIEIKRTSSSAYTVSISNGDDYNGDVLSATGGSTSATALRYIKFGDQANNSTQPWNGKIENVQFWDNTTTAGSGTAVSIDLASEQGALVSSLSDKSGLKAHYTMDSTAGTVVDDDLSTDSGWVSTVTGNGYDETNDRVNFKLSCPPDSSSHAGGRVIIDVQDADWLNGSNMPDNFTARFKWRASAMANASANENRSYMGFFSSDAWGGTSQDSFYIQFWTNTSGIQTFRCECINGGTFQGGSENRVITTLTPSLNTDYYIELKKAGNTHTYRITTNSDYTGGTTATVTQTGIEDLRYFGFKSRGDNQANGGNNEGYIDDITITNDSLCANDHSTDSPITNLPAGSIMEATDNGKHYIWNATTSTWTEVA